MIFNLILAEEAHSIDLDVHWLLSKPAFYALEIKKTEMAVIFLNRILEKNFGNWVRISVLLKFEVITDLN